jgi:hypothetical protein
MGAIRGMAGRVIPVGPQITRQCSGPSRRVSFSWFQGRRGVGSATDWHSVMSQQVTDDDWRLQGQERYLSNATLFWRSWQQSRPNWDHDHCSFCWAKFLDRDDAPDVLREGYTTDDAYRWICASCAADFAARFKFTLIGGPAAT